MVSDSRGQVILLAAVLVAVIFVSLAFVVNAAISTDTVSIDGIDDVRDDDALQIQQEVRHGVQEAIVEAGTPGEFGSIMGDLESSLRTQYAHGDRFIRLDVDSVDFTATPSEADITLTYDSPQTHYEATINVEEP
ncbi:DUF7261 family protein [Halococcoides cellulosivorans]|uniref:Uncharacterized protein n=1 Tax=Halococcoides cellulosivorans TaxID=1679096 RepID=A0A2R4WXK5_9EURY|nr:hypothetical protein [Halococcoides cellulosivorans]AWB26241.1 hypothetical protein HARCEL1_00150 [Halococcoides cellulosivorans]